MTPHDFPPPPPMPPTPHGDVFPPPPVKCPRCGQVAALAITRGFPGPELSAAIEAGRVEHRGCMVGPDDDDWTCRACGYEWQDRPR